MPRTLLAVALVWLLTACATIPITGPVEKATERNRQDEVGVEIAPQPPRPGASKERVIEGFLHAMASREDYTAARQFLVPAMRDRWDPDASISIYTDGQPIDTDADRAVMQGRLLGKLVKGSYSHVDNQFRHDFALVRDEHDEWRISNPPKGRLISEQLFSTLYVRHNLYFFDPNQQALVPDARFFARSDLTASSVTEALLAGPRAWLDPAVVSAIPRGTRIGALGVRVDRLGVATVDLDGPLASLSDADRRRLAAQVVMTVGQLNEVAKVRITVDGEPFPTGVDDAVGELDPTMLGNYAPVPRDMSSSLFGVQDGRLVRLVDDRRADPVTGAFGAAGTDAEQLALSFDEAQAAIVSEGRSQLWTAPTHEPAKPIRRLTAHGLLRPQFTRTGEVWVLASAGGSTRVYRLAKGQQPVRVAAPQLAGLTVTAFRISPDGTRLAVAGRRGQTPVFGLLRIVRAPATLVDGWRSFTLSPEGPAAVLDVGWEDASTLVVLGRKRGSLGVYALDCDALDTRPISPDLAWRVSSLAVSSEGSQRRVVALGNGQLWTYEDLLNWAPAASKVTAVSYPG